MAKIVVGGYGAICAPELLEHPAYAGQIDAVCQGEGVRFLCELLGEAPPAPLSCRLPKEGATLPWITPHAVGTSGVVLSGLGCTYRCPFCATSELTGGRYVEVMDAAALHQAMRRYFNETPFTSSVTVYDENFLVQREKVDALGRLLREDPSLGLSRASYAAFGSVDAVDRYDPDTLLLAGVETLWIGVESKFSPLSKRRGPVERTFAALATAGIKTIGSWILGEDFQTPQNVDEDLDHFIALDPTFQQLSVLTAVPSVPLYRRLARERRVPDVVPWSEQHLYGNTFSHPRFTHEQMLEVVARGYRRIHEEKGPALLKALEVSLNGYGHCRRSKRRLLREEKAAHFAERCHAYYPLLRTAREHAVSAAVRGRLDVLAERYTEAFGPVPDADLARAEAILRRAEAELERRAAGPRAAREEPYRRYEYPAREARRAARPYTVRYPEGDPTATR